MPIGHSRDFDLVAYWGQELVRVQVKTSACRENQRWDVSVCTRGGNQSWNRLVKKLDPERYEYLFVHVGDGRRWFIPATAVDGGCGIRLGGPKYDEFEIESGDPLPAYTANL